MEDDREENVQIVIPRSLQNRLSSLGTYVKIIVDEQETGIPKKDRLRREELQAIRYVVLIYMLNRIFLEGARTAREAVDELALHGIPELVIGRTRFAGRNENVMLGDRLSGQLKELCSGLGLDDLLKERYSVRELVLRLMGRVRDGSAVD